MRNFITETQLLFADVDVEFEKITHIFCDIILVILTVLVGSCATYCRNLKSTNINLDVVTI